MLKKITIGLVGIAVVAAGIAAFAAFTAQMVNLEAHVEKEIELSAVRDCGPDDPNTPQVGPTCVATTGDFGTILPQRLYDKFIELTLSKSFFDQRGVTDVKFDVLWECKQIEPPQDSNGDGFDDCRVVDPSNPNAPLTHSDPQHLDDLLRKYVEQITTNNVDACLKATQGSNPSKLPAAKYVEKIGSGVLDRNVLHKCFYQIKLRAPVCDDSFNKATDPLPADLIKTIKCHLVRPNDDIQTWERFADIGDEFKIQVTEHSVPANP